MRIVALIACTGIALMIGGCEERMKGYEDIVDEYAEKNFALKLVVPEVTQRAVERTKRDELPEAKMAENLSKNLLEELGSKMAELGEEYMNAVNIEAFKKLAGEDPELEKVFKLANLPIKHLEDEMAHVCVYSVLEAFRKGVNEDRVFQVDAELFRNVVADEVVRKIGNAQVKASLRSDSANFFISLRHAHTPDLNGQL